ncbi:MAG: biotin--[acetyl-CoA-carboxylase] ligase [Candidatus Cloacimonadota bacterium]|nr:MAG: biotin--[acetyl-CoA-carboxylase] ligase [Candidatus Cloacimonadota bacterium]
MEHPFFDSIKKFKKTGSTHKKAESLIKSREISGNFLLTAETQTSGKGRKGNKWDSPEGGIWLSAGCYGLPVSSNLTVYTGIIIHRVLSRILPESENKLKIKWPNDIYYDGKKLCGIIASCLSQQKYHVLGIGINTNFEIFDESIAENAVSTLQILNKKIDNDELICKIFTEFSELLPEFVEKGLAPYLKYYAEKSFLINKKVELKTEFESYSGIALGINKKGALKIRLAGGMIQPFFGGTIVKTEN